MQSVERVLVLKNGPPWGFRLQEIYPEGLVVSEIRGKSPADFAGVQEHDKIVAIERVSTIGIGRIRAVQLINEANYQLELIVRRMEMKRTQKVFTFFLDTGAARGQQVQNESTTKEMQLAWQQEKSTDLKSMPGIKLRPLDPEVTPISIDKLLREYQPPQMQEPAFKKKTFSNSAFYSGAPDIYPTLEEQKALAHNVAESIKSIMNKNSRGANMFEMQRKRLEKLSNDESQHVVVPNAHVITIVANAPKMHTKHLFSNSDVPPPPPPPPSLPGLGKEFRVQVQNLQNDRATSINPQICFDLATALHTSDSRGANMFAKRRARAHNWEVDAGEQNVPPVLATQGVEKPKLVSKFVSRQDYSEQSCNLTDMTMRRYQNSIENLTTEDSSGESKSYGWKQAKTEVTERKPVEPPKNVASESVPTWRPVKFNIPQRAV